MELTEQNFRDRLKDIVAYQEQGGDVWDSLRTRLKEKGVEYCIVLPLFEVVLGFNPLVDIKMEHGSEKNNNQRFDFIVTPPKDSHYSLLVEAKSLHETNLKKHEEQIVKYMKENQEYPWGILTNGLDWHFYISKKFIEVKYNDSRLINAQGGKKVFKILSVSLNDKNFIEVMQAMNKNDFSSFWYNMAKYTYATITGGRGKRPNIAANKEINEFITEKIRDAVEVKQGEYSLAIKTGKMKAGDKVTCKNSFIDLVFELDNGGRLVLNPKMANMHDYNEFITNCPDGIAILEEWRGSTSIFPDRKQVIKSITGKGKGSKKLLDKFPFSPVP